jgi:hypothetical protein
MFKLKKHSIGGMKLLKKAKSLKDKSNIKSPKSSSDKLKAKSPKDKSKIKSSEDKTKVKSPKDKSKIKSPEDKTKVKSPKDKLKVKSPIEKVKSPKDKSKIKSSEDKTKVKSPKDKSKIKSSEDKLKVKSSEDKTKVKSPIEKVKSPKDKSKIKSPKSKVKSPNDKSKVKSSDTFRDTTSYGELDDIFYSENIDSEDIDSKDLESEYVNSEDIDVDTINYSSDDVIYSGINSEDIDTKDITNIDLNSNQTAMTDSKDIDRKILFKFQKFREKLVEIENRHLLLANNPYYKPLISTQQIDVDSKKIYSLYAEDPKNISEDDRIKIKEKLLEFDKIKSSEIRLYVSKGASIDNLITSVDDEINEGLKLVEYLKPLVNKLFLDLDIKINNGYVYLTRALINPMDKVTEELAGKLKYYDWQYNRPIDYTVLKYALLHNEFQSSIAEDTLEKREAEKILSLEYVIALQADPKFHMWMTKRLLMIWYGDEEFEKNVRLVKLLINYYRADPFNEYNKINGLLPMILIYSRYGVESARIVIKKLEYYFSLYTNDDTLNLNKIYFNGSHPSFFIKKNNLLYYSNGSIDIKLYIRESKGLSRVLTNVDSFDKDMKEFKVGRNILVI